MLRNYILLHILTAASSELARARLRFNMLVLFLLLLLLLLLVGGAAVRVAVCGCAHGSVLAVRAAVLLLILNGCTAS
jgi:hypothetical protein